MIIGNSSINRHYIEDGKLYSKTTSFDDVALAKIARIRNEQIIGEKLGIHDYADIRMVISCPDVVQWGIFIKKYPDVIELLHSNNEEEWLKGAARIEILHPEWIGKSRM